MYFRKKKKMPNQIKKTHCNSVKNLKNKLDGFRNNGKKGTEFDLYISIVLIVYKGRQKIPNLT